ncbi:MAG: metal-sensing transcriptional repressor [Lachnospiraceae bacterium]|nr:metal-sensing transcriptional repressor [Lachnospiraceae bacterium]
MEKTCCSGKKKEREEKEKKDLMNRLKRIEGQVRGLENMLEKDAYCTDLIMQVSAVTSALNGFQKLLLENHLKTCVANNVRQGNDEVIEEFAVLMRKLL